jgi:plasmid stabilization system protein ParE
MYEKTIRFTVGDRLSSMPQKYRRVDDPLLGAMGLRRMNVKSHAVFFSIDEEEKSVKVERVIHSKRDLINVLRAQGR